MRRISVVINKFEIVTLTFENYNLPNRPPQSMPEGTEGWFQ